MLSTSQTQCVIQFAGQEMLLDARGALYWPNEQMLIVSDLHFEKSSYLAKFGSPIPLYDTRDTLHKLEKLIHDYRPRQLVCLGDSFHDRLAYDRFHAEDRTLLNRLIGQVGAWHWVLGNHDASSPVAIAGESHEHIMLRDILLTHEQENQPYPQIIGHYHPKLQLRMGGQRVSGPCFVVTDSLLIMPALGSYTGGLDVKNSAITSLCVSTPRHYMLYRQRLWSF